MKVRKQTQSLVLIALAVSQCYVLSGCASRAMLDPVKKAAALKAAALKAAGQPAPTGLPNNSPSPGPAPGQTPSAAAGDTTFNSSLASVDFDLNPKDGTALLSFSHWPTPSQISTIGPLVTHLTAAAATAGADMDPPPGVLGYTAHITCKTADCASAVVSLSKSQAPLQGKAVIHIDRATLTKQTFSTVGTLKGLEANVVAAFKSQGKIDTVSTLKRVENGATFFKVDCRFPSGAIVPGQPAGDAGRRVIVKGQLGDHVTISLSYTDTDSDVAAGTRQEYKGSATYSEADSMIHVNLDGTDDGIHALGFGEPSI